VDGSTLFISASFAFRFPEQKKKEVKEDGVEGKYISNTVSRENLSACLSRIVARSRDGRGEQNGDVFRMNRSTTSEYNV